MFPVPSAEWIAEVLTWIGLADGTLLYFLLIRRRSHRSRAQLEESARLRDEELRALVRVFLAERPN